MRLRPARRTGRGHSVRAFPDLSTDPQFEYQQETLQPCASDTADPILAECPDTFSVSPHPSCTLLDNLPHTVCGEWGRFAGVLVDIEVITAGLSCAEKGSLLLTLTVSNHFWTIRRVSSHRYRYSPSPSWIGFREPDPKRVIFNVIYTELGDLGNAQ